MTIYYISPSVKILNKFDNIMNNIINDISNLFVTNRNLIISDNYDKTILEIISVTVKYLKIYKFYEYGINNIYIQIYNKTIDVIINIKFNISKTYFSYIANSWSQLYFGTLTNTPVIYEAMDNNQKKELDMSIINGNLYYLNIDLNPINFNNGIILKKETCDCDKNNCNITFNYIVTIFW
jgi:hypothetical protein